MVHKKGGGAERQQTRDAGVDGRRKAGQRQMKSRPLAEGISALIAVMNEREWPRDWVLGESQGGVMAIAGL